MPTLDILIPFTIAAMILNLSPGPSNLYVIARAIGQGGKAGVVSAIGLSVGGIIHVLAAVFGLSAIFLHSPTLYLMVKFIGAVYLIYLGIRLLKSTGKGSDVELQRTPEKPMGLIFRESIFVEVTNPKTALFFIALLPQFVIPETASVPLQLFVLGMIVVLSAIPCDVIVALSANKVFSWMAGGRKIQRRQEQVSGGILTGLGSYLLVDELI